MTHAVVTGASTGIGRAVATSLASPGNRVALLGRNADGLEETARRVHAGGGHPVVVRCDLADPASCTAAAGVAREALDTVDVIANVAGVWHGDDRAYQGPLLYETPAAEICEVLDAGLRGAVLLTAALLPAMVEQRSGHVVNVSGTFSGGAKGWLHYYLSKKGLEQFTVGLAEEMRDVEVQVNCLSPADVATEAYLRFYPEYAASAVSPEEVAEVFTLLVSGSLPHVTGQILEIRNRRDHG